MNATSGTGDRLHLRRRHDGHDLQLHHHQQRRDRLGHRQRHRHLGHAGRHRHQRVLAPGRDLDLQRHLDRRGGNVGTAATATASSIRIAPSGYTITANHGRSTCRPRPTPASPSAGAETGRPTATPSPAAAARFRDRQRQRDLGHADVTGINVSSLAGRDPDLQRHFDRHGRQYRHAATATATLDTASPAATRSRPTRRP